MNDQIIISLSPEMEELQRKETSKKVFTQEGVGLRYPISGVLDSCNLREAMDSVLKQAAS